MWLYAKGNFGPRAEQKIKMFTRTENKYQLQVTAMKQSFLRLSHFNPTTM